MRTVTIAGQFLAGEDQPLGRMCWIDPQLAERRLTTEVSGVLVELRFPERSSADVSPEGYVGRMGTIRRIQSG